ncbi:hypothetical protein [Burkholderia sp. Bp9143]|uniref:hypothetical protein n=1 Tax=Burkholderia sp. Bp9143 TaxID=2184574 RepID=UPI000F5B4CC6|nr:hypothetical protein [Burkholderia sp. Bp9143]
MSRSSHASPGTVQADGCRVQPCRAANLAAFNRSPDGQSLPVDRVREAGPVPSPDRRHSQFRLSELDDSLHVCDKLSDRIIKFVRRIAPARTRIENDASSIECGRQAVPHFDVGAAASTLK